MAMQQAGTCFGEKSSGSLPKVPQKISSRGSDENKVQIRFFYNTLILSMLWSCTGSARLRLQTGEEEGEGPP